MDGWLPCTFVYEVHGISLYGQVAHPASKALMDRGDLIPDDVVLDALFSEILNPAIDDSAGLIIDGFPRTESQVMYTSRFN